MAALPPPPFSNVTNDSQTGEILNGYPSFGLPAVAAQMLRSAHTGGSVVAFCDGHSYFLVGYVDTNVYIQLVTSNGGRLPAGNVYKVPILNESAF